MTGAGAWRLISLIQHTSSIITSSGDLHLCWIAMVPIILLTVLCSQRLNIINTQCTMFMLCFIQMKCFFVIISLNARYMCIGCTTRPVEWSDEIIHQVFVGCKFTIKWHLKIPPHLKCFATLLCEILPSAFNVWYFARWGSDAFVGRIF